MNSPCSTTSTRPAARPALLIVGILAIAANLRAPVTGVAPVLDLVRETCGLGTAAAGALTTLPLLAFAIASPFSVLLARECGLERSLFMAIVLIAGGVILRAIGPVWTLFLGTGVIGVGIAIANVLLPSIIKRDFPDRIATLTSLYALTAGVVAALASIAAVPIAHTPGLGWNWALGAFLLFPVAALVIWLPQRSSHTAPAEGTATPPHGGSVWRSTLGWQVTFFFGLNSLIYYVIMAWLPTMLTEAGYSAAAAGSLHGISQLATAVPGLIVGPLIRRLRDQKVLAAGTASLTAIALLGIMLLPNLALIWSTLFGFSAGASFILALAFVSLRANSAPQAAALSGMAQAIGYMIAAAAPPLGGLMHDASQSWFSTLAGCVVLCCAMAGFGLRAGRSIQIS